MPLTIQTKGKLIQSKACNKKEEGRAIFSGYIAAIVVGAPSANIKKTVVQIIGANAMPASPHISIARIVAREAAVKFARLLPINNWNSLMKFIDTPYFVINHHDEYPNNLLFLDLLETKNVGLMILPTTSKPQGKSAHKIYSWQQKLFSRI